MLSTKGYFDHDGVLFPTFGKQDTSEAFFEFICPNEIITDLPLHLQTEVNQIKKMYLATLKSVETPDMRLYFLQTYITACNNLIPDLAERIKKSKTFEEFRKASKLTNEISRSQIRWFYPIEETFFNCKIINNSDYFKVISEIDIEIGTLIYKGHALSIFETPNDDNQKKISLDKFSIWAQKLYDQENILSALSDLYPRTSNTHLIIEKKLVKNSFKSDDGKTFYLYQGASAFNHSCLANAVVTDLDETILIYALKDIKQNEEITISYSKAFCSDSVEYRKTQLDFECNCSACLDPTSIQPFDGLVFEASKVNNHLDMKICFWCAKTSDEVTLKKCSLCHIANYCNKNCQREHWKTRHKYQCKIFQTYK